jgi:gluconolactonase
MKIKQPSKHILITTSLIVYSVLTLSGFGQTSPDWKAVNEKLIGDNRIPIRERADIPDTGVTPNLPAGKVTNINTLKEVELAPGVKSRMYWGKGVLVSVVEMTPGSALPEEVLPGERLMIMMSGTVQQLVNGKYVEMRCQTMPPAYYYKTGDLGSIDCLYLEKGTLNAVKAGKEPAKFIEVYYPIRADYLEKAGEKLPINVKFPKYDAKPNFPANKVFNYYEIQLTELAKGAWSKLINGKGAQVSMLSMEPDCDFPLHTHPEEQLMMVLRGSSRQRVLDGIQLMKEGDIVYLPSQMAHGGIIGDKGADVIDIFWPVRSDYCKKYADRMKAYEAIIPGGENPKLIAEGFKFCEGGAWLDGKYYFSSMFFDIPAGTWKPDPDQSDLMAVSPEGKVTTIWKGKTQSNGMMVNSKTKTLIVVDMSGHRIVEVKPNGDIVRVIADKMSDGTRLDGPNDLVIDAKGGIYFSDPQFIRDEKKRPGKTVNYISPDGKQVIEVVPPGEFGMENGVELSPDGKYLYVNNTYHNKNNMSEVENWVIRYDVHPDGTLSNKTKWAKLFLPGSEYEIGTRSSCADGSCVDNLGNVYQCTNLGIQIFNPKGQYIGTIFTPTFPVNMCFGGENNDTIYMGCWDKVYSIKTKVKGLLYPLSGGVTAKASDKSAPQVQ